MHSRKNSHIHRVLIAAGQAELNHCFIYLLGDQAETKTRKIVSLYFVSKCAHSIVFDRLVGWPTKVDPNTKGVPHLNIAALHSDVGGRSQKVASQQ